MPAFCQRHGIMQHSVTCLETERPFGLCQKSMVSFQNEVAFRGKCGSLIDKRSFGQKTERPFKTGGLMAVVFEDRFCCT